MVNHHYLTHDEQLASEAAFQGKPLNPAWSQRAREWYLGASTCRIEEGE
mgnify:CR=1 FL=1